MTIRTTKDVGCRGIGFEFPPFRPCWCALKVPHWNKKGL